MYRLLSYAYLLLRLLLVVLVIAGAVWIGNHPERIGEWRARYMKAQLTEFNKR